MGGFGCFGFGSSSSGGGGGSTPLIPDNQVVDNPTLLPDPVTSDGEYWIADNASGTRILGTRQDAGIYKATGGSWSYKGVDVPYYFVDDQLTFKDDSDETRELGYQLSSISTGTRRIATWQDKDGTVAYLGDSITVVDITSNYNIPSIVGFTGVLRLSNRSGNSYTVTASGGETIENASSQTIFDGETFDLTPIGTNWTL